MYAIVEIAGKQYKVSQDKTVVTDKLEGKVGDTVDVDRVLMVVDGDKVKVGKPTVKGVKVSASIAGHKRGDKVIVFKMKRRKGYRRTRGHKQPYTELRVDSISVA